MAAREEGLVVQRAIRIRATPERVLIAFFNPDDLATWWEVSRSVTLARPLGPFAVEWPPTDFTDEVLGKLGGTLHGTVMDVSPGVSFFVADLYYQPPSGHTIGPMALNVQARPLDSGRSTEPPSGSAPTTKARCRSAISRSWATAGIERSRRCRSTWNGPGCARPTRAEAGPTRDACG